LASDISGIIKSELSTTLESLLSVSSSVEDVALATADEYSEHKCLKVDTSFDFGGNSSKWTFLIPTDAATKFEYLMLGGVTDLKSEIDDEINDAVKEIVSTISGSIVTSVNAQGFDDITGVKFTLGESSIINCTDQPDIEKGYKLSFTLNDETFQIVIIFDDVINPFVSGFANKEVATSNGNVIQEGTTSTPSSTGSSVLSSILGEESIDNLRLLFDIKMRLSVRLGTKTCLLRDVVNWDIGEIIELSQMTSEPLDILVNGVPIGKGEAIIVDGKFGIKIKSIGLKKSGE
jgi:flagellar motor switch protein FliN/FliY